MRPRHFHPPIQMQSKALGITPVFAGVLWLVLSVKLMPRPAAELGAPIPGQRFLDLGASVHDERAVLHDRFGDWFALQQQKICGQIAIGELNSLIRAQRYPVLHVD